MTFKKTMEPSHIEIEFEVGMGSGSYTEHVNEVVERIASKLASLEKPHFNFKRGELYVGFCDGHDGITPEMAVFVKEIRDKVEGLNVEMTGSGMGAFPKAQKGNLMRIALKASQQHEFDFRPSQGRF